MLPNRNTSIESEYLKKERHLEKKRKTFNLICSFTNSVQNDILQIQYKVLPCVKVI